MEHTQGIIGKSLTIVLWEKFVSFIDSHTMRELALYVGLSLLAGILSASVLDLSAVVDTVAFVFQWKHNAVPMIALIFAMTYNAPRFFRATWNAILDTWDQLTTDTTTESSTSDTIEGIPVPELLDHLFETRSFKRGDVEAKFGIPRYRYTALAKKMKELGVLTHGENNSTILADVSREEVMDLLRGKESAEELSAFKIIRPIPSSAAPLFTRRTLTNG